MRYLKSFYQVLAASTITTTGFSLIKSDCLQKLDEIQSNKYSFQHRIDTYEQASAVINRFMVS